MKEDTTTIDPTWMERTGGFAKDMTLHDWYAGMALQGLLANKELCGATWGEAAQWAISMAYRMLEAREAK